MINDLFITIPGKPIAKKRPRFYRRGSHVGAYDDQKSESGKFIINVMNQLSKDFKKFDSNTPLRLACLFTMPIPKSTSKKKRAAMLAGEIYHTKKPDCDNLIKFVKDCCNEIIWHDDSQVVHVAAKKEYGENPSTAFRIQILKGDSN
jgi:Holliday junction resolvase RusA-like endonuclease